MRNYSLSLLKRKHLVIFISALAVVGWLSLVMYTLSESQKSDTFVSPGELATAPMQTAEQKAAVENPTLPSSTFPGVSPKVVTDQSMRPFSFMPQPEMKSTSSHILQTHNATAKSVGSGTAEATGYFQASHANHSQNRGITYNGLSFGGNMLAMSSAIVLSKPGEGNANNLAQLSGPSDRHGARKDFPDENDGPIIDAPIGSVPFILFVLLAVGYALRKVVKGERVKE